MPKILNQRGAIPPLVLGVIAVLVIGGIFLLTQKSSNPQTADQKQTTVQQTQSSETEWETYQDKQYGYSIKHPTGWTVENVPSQDTRIIKVSSSDKLAFVMIEAIGGPTLENEGAVDVVVKYMEDKLRNNSELRVTNLAKKTEGATSGFIAQGEYATEDDTPDEQKIIFEERFLVAKNGRGLRIHSAYAKGTKETNAPITAEIIKSFSTN